MSKRALKPRTLSAGQAALIFQCRAFKLPPCEPEFYFAKPRLWRFDVAFPPLYLAVEIDGGTFSRVVGRHSRGLGIEHDCVKYGEAMIRGWRILRVTTDMVTDGRAVAYLEKLILLLQRERLAP